MREKWYHGGGVKKCQICGKPASVFLTQIANGKLVDVALCKKCAREHGFFDPRRLLLTGQFFPKELSGQVEELIRRLLDGDDFPDELPVSSEDDAAESVGRGRKRARCAICPNCGYTWAKFRESHQLGCPKCYEHFEDRLREIYSPQEWDAEDAEESGIITEQMLKEHLDRNLKRAVKKEEYEEAARLRDCIRELDEP